MIDKKTFKSEVGKTLGAGGFTQKGSSWFMTGRDGIAVVELQKSDFQEKYYVNFGIWLKRFGPVTNPRSNHCQLQSRLGSLFPDHRSKIEEACTLNASSAEAMRDLNTILRQELIPLCADCLLEEQLRALIEAGRFESSLVMKILRDALQIQDREAG